MPFWLRSLFGQRDENAPVDLDLQWGGYYASRENDQPDFRVFRLLDFQGGAYHAALFSEKFPQMPALADVASLAPFVGHVPMDARGLLSPPLHLLGGVPLTPADLEGYMIYLENFGATEEQRAALQARLIDFSHQTPFRARLSLAGDRFQIEERP